MLTPSKHCMLWELRSIITAAGRRQSRTEAAHSQDDIIVKSEYTCKTCGKVFHREAILRRHVYYAHNTNFDKPDDDDEDEEEGEGGADTAEEPPPPASGGDVGGRRKRRIAEKEILEFSDEGDTEYRKKQHACTLCNRLFSDVSHSALFLVVFIVGTFRVLNVLLREGFILVNCWPFKSILNLCYTYHKLL